MISSSAEFNTAVLEGGHPYQIRITKGGTLVDCNIFACTIYKGSTGSESFGVGTVFVPYIEMELDSLSVALENEEILLEVGLDISGTTEWIKIGYFTVRDIKASYVRTKITAIGRIATVLNIVPTLSTPTTIASVIADIQTAVRADGYTNFTIDYSHVDVTGGTITESLAGYTCRELLEIVAGVTGCYITEDNNGNVIIFNYLGNAIAYAVDEEGNVEVFNVEYNIDNDGNIEILHMERDTTVYTEPTTGNVQISNSGSGSYIHYTGDNMLVYPSMNNFNFELDEIKVIVAEAYDEEDGTAVAEQAYVSGTPISWAVVNRFMASQTMFDTFCNNCLGLVYRPGTITLALGDPRLEPTDKLLITDVDGSMYVMPCLSVVHTINGGVISAIVTPGDPTVNTETSTKGPLTKQVERMNAELLTAQDAIINRAKIDAANINTATIRTAWIDKLLVQSGLLAQTGTVYELDAIQVNAAKITAGTIDVQRLIVTVNNEKYLVQFDAQGNPTYQKLDGNIVADNTIAASKIVANSITANQITTANIVGTNGWINLNQGTFFYGDGATWAACTKGIYWDGTDLKIKGDMTVTAGNVYTKTETDSLVSGAEKVATDYLTQISGTSGISVHDVNDTSNYVNIASNLFKIVTGGVERFKAWVENNVAKIRVGAETAGHVLIQSSGMDVYGGDGTKNLAHIGYDTGNAQSGTSVAPFYSFGERDTDQGVGNYSVAEGRGVVATGHCSHAEGYESQAKGSEAHAEGHRTQATQSGAHSEGYGSSVLRILASGYGAHAEGYAYDFDTIASGIGSHAEGRETLAYGEGAHSEGYGTIAYSDHQHAQGKYNKQDTNGTYADIVGGGTSSARKNIEATTWTGDKRMKGDVYVGCNDDSTGGNKVISEAQIDIGEHSFSNLASNTATSIAVTFNKTFSSAPQVVAGLKSSLTSANTGNVAVSASNVTTTGFTLRAYNGSTAQKTIYVSWIAVGI